MGSSGDADARPIIELFQYITSILGQENKLHVITATRLAMIKQIEKSEEELLTLYPKLNLSPELAHDDFVRNKQVLEECYRLGQAITSMKDD